MTYRISALFIFTLFFCAFTLPAQTAPIAPSPIPPPMLPIRLSYRYWPVQFVQFVGPELPYSLVMLEVVPEKHPLMQVTLTDRQSGKRVHYTDADVLLASAAAAGEEAHKVTLAYEPADTDNAGSVTSVRFTMPDGKPLQWRFVQGSDISQKGSGLSPNPDSKLPIFAYREQGAVAGEGTVLEIGDIVSPATVWKEISQPPYFIGYHGAATESAHTLVFLAGSETWSIKTAPASLTVGLGWELTGDQGRHRSLRIDKIDGAKITVTGNDSAQPGVHYTLEADRSSEGWNLERVRFAPDVDGEKHGLTLQFARPLSKTADHVPVTLVAGAKTILANAVLSAGENAVGNWTITFNSPAWLSGKTMTESWTEGPQTVTLSAQP